MSQSGQNFVDAYSRSNPTSLAPQADFPPTKPPKSTNVTAAFESPIERRIDPGQEIGQTPHLAEKESSTLPASSQNGPRWKRIDSQSSLELRDDGQATPEMGSQNSESQATQQQLIESLEHVVFVDRVTLPADGWPDSGGVLDTAISQTMNAVSDVPLSANESAASTSSVVGNPNDSASAEPGKGSGKANEKSMRVCWELDVFDVPRTVAKLFFDQERFEAIGGRLIDAAQSGLKSMMITSRSPGEGRTSVAIGMALAAASGPLRIALLDADGATDSIASQMHLEVAHGWLDHVRDGVNIEETGVYSHEDNLVLFPMMRRDDGPMHPAECGSFVWRLREQFDLVLVDAPAATRLHAGPMADSIDSAVIVEDSRLKADDDSIQALATNLRLAGIEGIGLVKNFLS